MGFAFVERETESNYNQLMPTLLELFNAENSENINYYEPENKRQSCSWVF